MTKLVVAAVAVLAAVAAADAVRDDPKRDAGAAAARAASVPRHVEFVPGRSGVFRGHGHYLHDHVLRRGREYLSADEIAAAFPVPVEGPLDISQVAVAPDGTLVLGVYRFPARSDARGALSSGAGARSTARSPSRRALSPAASRSTATAASSRPSPTTAPSAASTTGAAAS